MQLEEFQLIIIRDFLQKPTIALYATFRDTGPTGPIRSIQMRLKKAKLLAEISKAKIQADLADKQALRNVEISEATTFFCNN